MEQLELFPNYHEQMAAMAKANDVQVAGNHYKQFNIYKNYLIVFKI